MRKAVCILSLLMCLHSCADKSWRGVTDEMYDDLDNGIPVPVLISVGADNPAVITPVRGSGAVDAEDGRPWKDIEMEVFAFSRASGTSYGSTASQSAQCLIDGSLDRSGDNGGRKAFYDGKSRFISWTRSDETLYYPAEKTGYDFFAYYLDDCPAGKFSRKKDRVTIPVTIDGARDLMSACGEILPEHLSAYGFSDFEKELIRKYAFSSYSARRNIYPVLVFRHHLTRLRFVVYPGSSGANTVYINELKARSKNEGIFTVAARDKEEIGISFESDRTYADIALCEADGSPLEQNKYHTEYEGDFNDVVFDRSSFQLGGSLLLAPDEEYTISLTTVETREGRQEFHPEPFTIRLSEGFKAGCQYVVRIILHGMREVEPTVELEPWGTGGYIILDEEDEISND